MVRMLCALLVVACAEPKTPDDATSNVIAAYRVQQRQIEITASRYDNALVELKEAPELCISMHRAYNRDVRDNVFQLGNLDVALDAAITAHGGDADLACTTAGITDELDYHGAVACQETAVEDNLAEATRHLLALGALLDHAAARIDEVTAGVATEAETWIWTLPSRCP